MQISFDRLFAKHLQFFFAKLVQSVSLCHRLSKKLNFIKIWQAKVGQNKDLVCDRQKQSFRQCAWGLRQVVLKPVLGLNGGLWVCKKSQKISTASDQYFLSYVKKTTGGVKLTPPSRNRVKWMQFYVRSDISPGTCSDRNPLVVSCGIHPSPFSLLFIPSPTPTLE